MEPRSQVNAKAEPWEIHDGPGSVLELSVLHVLSSSQRLCQSELFGSFCRRRMGGWESTARGQTQVPSHVLPPPCAATSDVGLGQEASSDFVLHPPFLQTGGLRAVVRLRPQVLTQVGKPGKEIAEFEKHALKWDFLRPEGVFTEKFYRD